MTTTKRTSRPTIKEQDVRELVNLNDATRGNLGYLGNSSRNYLTDYIVAKVATRLHLTVNEVYLWGCSKHGRWAMDSEFRNATQLERYLNDDIIEDLRQQDPEWYEGASNCMASYALSYGTQAAMDDFPGIYSRCANTEPLIANQHGRLAAR